MQNQKIRPFHLDYKSSSGSRFHSARAPSCTSRGPEVDQERVSRGRVSLYCGVSALSSRASLICRMQKFKPTRCSPVYSLVISLGVVFHPMKLSSQALRCLWSSPSFLLGSVPASHLAAQTDTCSSSLSLGK